MMPALARFYDESMADRLEMNRAIIDEFRANHGQVAQFAGVPLLLLTTIGARTGQARTSPTMYVRDGDRYVVFGTNGGRDVDPAWCRNLASSSGATIEVGEDRLAVLATFVDGAERERLWKQAIETNPMFADFRAKTSREILVVILELNRS